MSDNGKANAICVALLAVIGAAIAWPYGPVAAGPQTPQTTEQWVTERDSTERGLTFISNGHSDCTVVTCTQETIEEKPIPLYRVWVKNGGNATWLAFANTEYKPGDKVSLVTTQWLLDSSYGVIPRQQ